MSGTTHDLALARAQAAANLETATAAFGVAYRAYEHATQALESRVDVELARYLEVPLVLHLARAGLSGFLERKLTGTPPALRALVEDQHRRVLAIDHALPASERP